MTGTWEAVRIAWLGAAFNVAALPLGAVAFAMCWQLHRGRWWLYLGPVMEACVRTLPLAVLMVLPAMAQDREAMWVGIPVAVCWLVLALPMWRSAPIFVPAGLIIYTLSTSFAAFYWILALQPEAHSSIFGLIFISQQMTTALAFAILVALAAQPVGNDDDVGGIGNILLGSVLLWSYFDFMQYLVTWSGDQPNHIALYLARSGGAWTVAIWAVVMLNGVVPLVLLLMRTVRRNRRWLVALSALILPMRIIEGLWLVVPTAEGETTPMVLAMLVVAALFIAAALWGAAFTFALRRHPMRAVSHA